MNRILFRADAKPSIGIGDLMSLITLSKNLDEGWDVFFLIKSYKTALELINKHNIKNILIMDKEISLENEILFINTEIKKLSIDILFLEITEIKLSHYIGLDSSVKKIAVNFDGDILNDLDLVINWDVTAHTIINTNKYPNTKFLLGPEYVILPKDLYNVKNTRNLGPTPKKILIAMGGADEFNMTQKIIDTLKNNLKDIEVTIILGSGYKHSERLRNSIKNSTLQYNIRENITNIIEEYFNCDLAIGAGGLTASELVASKTPTILIATYEHQIARCKYFEEHKLVKYLGFRQFNQEELINVIKKPIQNISHTLFKSNKIVHEIQNFMYNNKKGKIW